MIQDYIEGKLTEQVTLLNALLDFQDIHLSQLATLVNAGEKKVADTLKDLALLYEDQLSWTIRGGQVQLETSILDNKLHYFYAIYQNSLFLQTLHFFLDPKQKDFSDFSQSQFVSTATAYRLKKKCLNFLKEVGLTIRHNQIAGPEHRMRFLIALLHYRYGFPIYEFAKKDLDLVKDIIVTSNKTLNLAILENTPEEYQFFSYLVILSWYRHDYPLSDFCDHNLEHLKSIFIFDRVSTICSHVLEPRLGIQFSEREREYLFLAYCTTNNALYKDQWTSKDIEQTLTMVTQKTPIRHLILKFEQLLGPQMTSSQPFLILMVFLMKQCFLNLQCLTPYQEVSSFSARKEETFFALVDDLISEWAQEVNLTLTLTPHRFTIQLIEMIKSQLPPIAVYVFANTITNLHTLTMILSQQFSSKIASIEGVNFLSEPLKQHRHRRKSLILAEHNCLPYLKTVYSEDDYVFVEVASDAYELYQDDVFNAFHQLRQEQYQTFIASICDRHKRLKNHDTY
ncbi:M protein trans-acting positive regulator (MGA) PRD domain protein [Streptococcus dysgalactiae]|uniref:helix-turn-helix domain-containing protein n=1 Tax=Streptococcus dysgalactiae TaxID=1334 RepID=UPI000DCAE0B8|nr:helix-turn-helix domain-containing protein [Streptococcus dysgalactiae]BBE40394.1 M protein trans-acting positive regulator (MGA) PRD domain protein [Streptococcus dysgalactiae]